MGGKSGIYARSTRIKNSAWNSTALVWNRPTEWTTSTTMKLFKKHRFRAGGRGTARASQAPTAEVASIGSELSESDQFDIIVPAPTEKGTGLFSHFGGSGDDQSDISSITTHDRHYSKSRRRLDDKSTTVEGGLFTTCCYGTTAASSTNNASDSMLVGDPKTEATAVTGGESRAGSSFFEWNCCNPKTETGDIIKPRSKTHKDRDSVSSVNRQSSLFDSMISDDDDQQLRETETVSRIKRKKGSWKPSLRKAMPWRRNRQRGDSSLQPPTTVE